MSLLAAFKKCMTLMSIVLFVFCIIVILRTLTIQTHQADIVKCKETDFDFISATHEVVERFRDALRFRTISIKPGNYDRLELLKFIQYIKSAYPRLHSSRLVQHEVVANYSLLYTIKGSNSSLTPYLLMAHLDVVAAEPDKWDVPPFDAEIKDDFIYARGTIDFKHGVMGILEALDFYISREIQPARGFYVAFGHDEEVGGEDGALAISDLLASRGVDKLQFILDEGLTVTHNIVPGMVDPVAIIGSSEKGMLSLELTVEGIPGHSSMPPPQSTIGILSNAISRLEYYPQPSMLGYGPELDTFEHLAPYMQLPHRVVMSNLWLFGRGVSWMMSRKPVTNALIRTVTAVTMFNAGIKINVNAPKATAYVNHRIHPAQTVQQVIDYDRMIINDDRVKIRNIRSMESHPIAPSGAKDYGYQTVKNSIRQVWTDVYVAPGTMIGNTDTQHYLRYTDDVYRFSPSVLWPDDVKRFHGDNERISIKNYEQAINFYYHIIVNANKERLDSVHKHGEL